MKEAAVVNVMLGTMSTGTADTNCTTGDLRLYNSTVSSQGMLQQCSSTNEWEAVCNYNWDCDNAKVACRQLGFDDSR